MTMFRPHRTTRYRVGSHCSTCTEACPSALVSPCRLQTFEGCNFKTARRCRDFIGSFSLFLKGLSSELSHVGHFYCRSRVVPVSAVWWIRYSPHYNNLDLNNAIKILSY